jgi:hypothetical protein
VKACSRNVGTCGFPVDDNPVSQDLALSGSINGLLQELDWGRLIEADYMGRRFECANKCCSFCHGRQCEMLGTVQVGYFARLRAVTETSSPG